MTRCEIRFLNTGSCRHPEAATLAGGRLSPVVFPSLVGLLMHPQEGPILFDTGYDARFLTATRPFPQRLYRWATPPDIPPDASARAQLLRAGVQPAEVRWVVVSHFHADHVCGLADFPAARIACSRRGLEAAREGGAWTALRQGVLRDLIPADIDARITAFEDRPRLALPADYAPFEDGADVLGDGSLLAVELPGHCPGHWGLALTAEDDRRHILAADAAWSSQAIREDRPPPGLTTALLGRTAPYRETLHRLHALSQRAPDVLITPSHCAERAEQSRAPAPPAPR